MSFRKYSLLLLVHFCLFTNAFAQYKSGYVISNEEDTIRGYIKYEDWEASPSSIFFKTELNSPVKEFGTDDISSFAVDLVNEYYVVKSIGVFNIYKSDVFFESPSVKSPKEFKRIFLQTIIKGPEATLYKYVNEGLETHYYIETPILFQELTNYSYYENKGGITYSVKREDYKKQLSSICINSAIFRSDLPNYTEKELIKYLEKYNSCFTGETIIYRSPPVLPTWDPIVGIGYDHLFEGAVYSAGFRLNFAKHHYNRFLRVTVNLLPGIREEATFYREATKFTASVFTAGFGRYLGTGNVRPYLVPSLVLLTNLGKDQGGGFLVTVNAGISFRRQFELELGHWNNFLGLVMDGDFFLPPSVSLHYYPNFRKKKK